MVRWYMAKREAYRFLLQNKIFEFPVSVEDYIEMNGWKLSTLSEAASFSDMHPEEFRDFAMDGGDGAVWCHNDEYHIIYDYATEPRTRFTLAHEIGHIQLDHLKDDPSLHFSNADTINLSAKEVEANVFAGRVLAPYTILLSEQYEKETEIMEDFGLSLSAAKVKMKELKCLVNLIEKGCDIFFKEAVEYHSAYCEYWGCFGNERFNPEKKKQMVYSCQPEG